GLRTAVSAWGASLSPPSLGCRKEPDSNVRFLGVSRLVRPLHHAGWTPTRTHRFPSDIARLEPGRGTLEKRSSRGPASTIQGKRRTASEADLMWGVGATQADR